MAEDLGVIDKKFDTLLEGCYRKYDWDSLNPFQIGKYAEYYAKMEFTFFRFDVFTPEIDDKGIDFIAKKNKIFFEIQVKSVRSLNYVFMQKDKFEIDNENLFLVLLIFSNNKMPEMFLIPAKTWKTPNELFVSREYKPEQKSKPEYGINLSKKNMDKLSEYIFENKIQELL